MSWCTLRSIGSWAFDQFARRYLEEYLGSGYEAMPLEVIAVELANRLGAGEVFDVLGAVAERL
jgi:hypothetical protein